MLKYNEFKECSTEYRTVPFWSWNDTLEEQELLNQIHEMYKKGMGGFFIHPRGGMKDEYLGEKYMQMVKVCIAEAGRLGMKAWLYDEDRFPSGGAGGLVVSGNGEFRAKALEMLHMKCSQVAKTADVVRIFSCSFEEGVPSDLRDITSMALEEIHSLEGTALVFKVVYMPETALWNHQSYTDLCCKEAVDRFIEITHEAYKKEVGEAFGSIVPGIFTDEPHFQVKTKGRILLPWTLHLEAAFSQCKFYDLMEHLPSLFLETGNYRKLRFDYWDVLSARFVASFSRNIYEWCEKNGMKSTGHYWEHGFPTPIYTGSTMPNYEFMHYPGIDMLFKIGADDKQFGNELIVKEVSSVGNQLGKERVLSETYGASGWDLSFEEQKRVADWQFALGINFVCQHLIHYSLKGYRKRDFPLSFYAHQPWWNCYKLLGDYLGRLSYALSQGEAMGDILVLHPSSSTWAEYSPLHEQDELKCIEQSVKAVCKQLCEHQYLYDLGDDILMERHGIVGTEGLTIGKVTYSTVIVPHMTVMRSSSFQLLKEFAIKGGRIVAVGKTPSLLDGVDSKELADFFHSSCVQKVQNDSLFYTEVLASFGNNRVILTEIEGKKPSNIYCCKRKGDSTHLYFLCNTSGQEQYRVKLKLEGAPWVEVWDAVSGNRKALKAFKEGQESYVFLEFYPATSYLLLADYSRLAEIPEGRTTGRSIVKTVKLEDWKVTRMGYNALILKQFCYQVNESEWESARDPVDVNNHIGLKLGFEWRNIFMRQPWMFTPEETGKKAVVKARYSFQLREELKGELMAAIESPEEFQVFINGNKVEELGEYYLDRGFQLFNIKHWTAPGRNEILLYTDNYNIHTELESVLIIGDFVVEKDKDEFFIASEGEIRPGDWTTQGYPYYSGTMEYMSRFELMEITRNCIFELEEPAGVAAVFINDAEAAILGWKPYSVDITEFLKVGDNEIRIKVMNSLQNLLGPHDRSGSEGIVTPGSFYCPTGDHIFASSGFNGKAKLRFVEDEAYIKRNIFHGECPNIQ